MQLFGRSPFSHLSHPNPNPNSYPNITPNPKSNPNLTLTLILTLPNPNLNSNPTLTLTLTFRRVTIRCENGLETIVLGNEPASAVSSRHIHLTSTAILLFSSTDRPQRRRLSSSTVMYGCLVMMTRMRRPTAQRQSILSLCFCSYRPTAAGSYNAVGRVAYVRMSILPSIIYTKLRCHRDRALRFVLHNTPTPVVLSRT